MAGYLFAATEDRSICTKKRSGYLSVLQLLTIDRVGLGTGSNRSMAFRLMMSMPPATKAKSGISMEPLGIDARCLPTKIFLMSAASMMRCGFAVTQEFLSRDAKIDGTSSGIRKCRLRIGGALKAFRIASSWQVTKSWQCSTDRKSYLWQYQAKRMSQHIGSKLPRVFSGPSVKKIFFALMGRTGPAWSALRIAKPRRALWLRFHRSRVQTPMALYSSFHCRVRRGVCLIDWAASPGRHRMSLRVRRIAGIRATYPSLPCFPFPKPNGGQ